MEPCIEPRQSQTLYLQCFSLSYPDLYNGILCTSYKSDILFLFHKDYKSTVQTMISYNLLLQPHRLCLLQLDKIIIAEASFWFKAFGVTVNSYSDALWWGRANKRCFDFCFLLTISWSIHYLLHIYFMHFYTLFLNTCCWQAKVPVQSPSPKSLRVKS